MIEYRQDKERNGYKVKSKNVRHTLIEYLIMLGPTKIQIISGKHLINIDTNCEGSYFIIKHFKNEKFALKDFRPFYKHIILEV